MFQSQWLPALLLFALFVPWAIWFIRRHIPKTGWKLPYADFQKLT